MNCPPLPLIPRIVYPLKTQRSPLRFSLPPCLQFRSPGIVSCAPLLPSSLPSSPPQMQVGALKGRLVYRDTFHCMQSIVREQGVAGLYRGLLPSCVKLMPAAGISFMCYEVLKRILIEEEGEGGKGETKE